MDALDENGVQTMEQRQWLVTRMPTRYRMKPALAVKKGGYPSPGKKSSAVRPARIATARRQLEIALYGEQVPFFRNAAIDRGGATRNGNLGLAGADSPRLLELRTFAPAYPVTL